jgi:hypothetical protein
MTTTKKVAPKAPDPAEVADCYCGVNQGNNGRCGNCGGKLLPKK